VSDEADNSGFSTVGHNREQTDCHEIAVRKLGMEKCDREKNMKNCTCSYEPCAKKGKCCECLQYHLRSGQLPACIFPPDVERTYDRSIEHFITTYQERGPWW